MTMHENCLVESVSVVDGDDAKELSYGGKDYLQKLTRDMGAWEMCNL